MDSNVDKEAVRRDYIRGLSLRQLAAKYGVSHTTVKRWAKADGWRPEDRARKAESVPERSDVPELGTLEKLPEDLDYATLRTYTNMVLSKANQLLSLDEPLAPRDLKSLSSMLLDVRQLLGILSPREAAEQEIRLIMLRKQATENTESKEINVNIMGMNVDELTEVIG